MSADLLFYVQDWVGASFLQDGFQDVWCYTSW